jgi:hypothetical protein
MAYDNESEFAEWAHSNERDVQLTFQWRSPQPAMAALDLPQPRNARHADTRNAVFTEAALAANQGRAVSYSRARPTTLVGSGITDHRIRTGRSCLR